MAAAIGIELKDIWVIMTKSEGKKYKKEFLTSQGNEKIHYRRIHTFG